MSWTNHMVADLKRHRDEGLSASKIARKMGRGLTKNAVIGRLYRMDHRALGFGAKWAELHRQYTEAGITRTASLVARQQRVDRIKSGIAAYPSKSICFAGGAQ